MTHAANLERVGARIASTILAWCRDRIAAGRPEFHVDDLRKHVAATLPTAPDSAGRILRDLRARGALDYVVVSRKASLYRLMPNDVEPASAGAGLPLRRSPAAPPLDDAGQACLWGAR